MTQADRLPAPLVRWLGRVEYEATWRAMQSFTDARGLGTADALIAGTSDPPGLAVLDTACNRTMHGRSWGQRCAKELERQGKSATVVAIDPVTVRGVGGLQVGGQPDARQFHFLAQSGVLAPGAEIAGNAAEQALLAAAGYRRRFTRRCDNIARQPAQRGEG